MSVSDGSNAMDLALTPLRTALSKPARRAYISTALFIGASLVLLVLALTAYTVFYLNFLPKVGLQRVVHLQYGAGHPSGLVALGDSLVSQQAYDVTVSLDLPRSPPNLAAGNFMLDLSLLSPASTNYLTAPTDDDVIVRSRRPAILTYTSRLVDTAQKAASIAWIVLGWHREAEQLLVPMMERVEFMRGWRNVPRAFKLELQSDQTLDVYRVEVIFKARFTGLRWIMYNHRILALFLFVTSFYLTSIISTGLAWVLLTVYLKPASVDEAKVKADPDSVTAPDTPILKTEDSDTDAYDLSDTPRNFPTYSRQPPLRYPRGQAGRSRADDPDPATPIQGLGDDGDDANGAGGQGGPGAGTGRRTDSGIGTSLDEAVGGGGGGLGGLQRRRSRGRNT